MVNRPRLVPLPMRCLPRHRSAVFVIDHIAFTPESASRFTASLLRPVFLFLLLDGLELLRVLTVLVGGLVANQRRLDGLIAAGFNFLPLPPHTVTPAVVPQLAQLFGHLHTLLVELLLDRLHLLVETAEVVLELIAVHGSQIREGLTLREQSQECLLHEGEQIAEIGFVLEVDAHPINDADYNKMKVRVQLVANSPLHRLPSLFVNLHRTQYIFNLLPTLLRHRKDHKVNLYNSSHLFFTANSIETLGGLPNFLLFRSGVEHANANTANKINIFCDGQVYNYLEKLRFKMGAKIMRISYCNWEGTRSRYGISNLQLFNQLKNDPKLPDLYAKIEEYLREKAKKWVDYYDSSSYITSKPTKFITVDCNYYHSDLMDIYPIFTQTEGKNYTHFLMLPSEMKKDVDVNLEEFVAKTGIIKQNQIKNFVKYGRITNSKGQVYHKHNFLFKQDTKPRNILIFHHTNSESLQQLVSSKIMQNYLENKNKTAVIVHILQDTELINTTTFQQFISKFGTDTKHMWYNQHFSFTQAAQQSIQIEEHLMQLKLWSIAFPQLFRDIHKHKLSYIAKSNHEIITALPKISSYFYQRLYNYVKNDYLGDTYEMRREAEPRGNHHDLTTQLLLENKSILSNLQQKCSKNCFHLTDNDPKVIFMGTASSMPTVNRNTLGILTSLCNKINFLLDCGEGTLQQMANHFSKDQFEAQLLKLRVIFITHIHSDHNLGILNLIHERNRLLKQQNKKEKLYLIIPFNVYNWYASFNQTISDLSEGCDVLFTQILMNEPLDDLKENEISIKDKANILEKEGKKGFQGKWKQQTYCNSSSTEQKIYDQLQKSAKTKELVLKQMPNQPKVLSAFESLLKSNGYDQFQPIRVIHCPQSFGIVISHSNTLKISYSGDTRPSQSFQKLASNSTLMIHQATFNDSEASKASNYLHSTVAEAITIGKQSNSHKLALTHFSEDFQDLTNEQYAGQLNTYFRQNTIFSLDHLQINLKNMQNLPEVSRFITKTQIEAANRLKKLKMVKPSQKRFDKLT